MYIYIYIHIYTYILLDRTVKYQQEKSSYQPNNILSPRFNFQPIKIRHVTLYRRPTPTKLQSFSYCKIILICYAKYCADFVLFLKQTSITS